MDTAQARLDRRSPSMPSTFNASGDAAFPRHASLTKVFRQPMTTIQIILVSGFIVAAVLAWFVLKKQLFIRLFFLFQFLLAIVLVVWPDLSTQIAALLGVGRGTDLILYLLVVFVYVAGLCILGKFRQQERKITTLTRELAILRAKHDKGSPAEGTTA